jgi:hypothetical protein
MFIRWDDGKRTFRAGSCRPHAVHGKAEFARCFFMRTRRQIMPETMDEPERLHHEEQERQGESDQPAM